MNEAEVAEKTYRAIGRFIFEFSQVEYTIRICLAEEIGIKAEYFSPIIETYDVSQLCIAAKEVVTGAHPHWNAKIIVKLINQFHELSHHGNWVAHGLWTPFMAGGTVHHVSRHNPKPKRDADQAKILEKYADEACVLGGAIHGRS